jgi:multicomponent Na+:H+ antiporter subunit G
MMTLAHPWLVPALLALAVLIVYLGCAGLLLARGPFNKIHAIGPASILSPLLIAAAMALEQPQLAAKLKILLIAALIVAASPFMAHLAGRAARLRHEDNLQIKPEEMEEH